MAAWKRRGLKADVRESEIDDEQLDQSRRAAKELDVGDRQDSAATRQREMRNSATIRPKISAKRSAPAATVMVSGQPPSRVVRKYQPFCVYDLPRNPCDASALLNVLQEFARARLRCGLNKHFARLDPVRRSCPDP